jgi:hypothetical protein
MQSGMQIAAFSMSIPMAAAKWQNFALLCICRSFPEQECATVSAIPAVNAPSYPRELIQKLLDQGAFFNLLAAPNHKIAHVSIGGVAGGGIIGVRLHDALHRLSVVTSPPAGDNPIATKNTVGQRIGSFNQRWMFVPDDFVALPDKEPPPTRLEPSRSQRFVMLDGDCSFGDGETGFRGFGTGFTIPSSTGSRNQVNAVAVGVLLQPRGELSRLITGLYIFNGVIRPERGFTGHFLLRIMDPQESLSARSPLPNLNPIENPDPSVAYFLLRGEAREKHFVQPVTGPDGSFRGLQISQDLRMCSIDSSLDDCRSLRTKMEIGPTVGEIHTTVVVDPKDPRGTSLAPIPGRVYGEYVFFDASGRDVAGFKVDFPESRSFRFALPSAPGVQSLLAGNIGRIFGGSGAFAGLDGLVSDNLLVSFFPHVSSGVYVLRVNDPQHKLRQLISVPR